MSQKIVIPKGLINPNETTIIEIPEQIQNVETVIAKPVYRRHCTCRTHNVPYGEHPNPEDSFDFTPPSPNEETEEYPTDFDYLYHQPQFDKKYCIYKPQIRCSCHENYEINYSPSILPTHQQVETSENDDGLKANEKSCDWPFTLPKLSTKNIIAVLDVMDRVELHKFQENLKEYQAARRKLLYETSSLDTLEDISATLKLLI